jgi:hypothetical protein
MTRQHLFAFGSNPFGKCCPGTDDTIVRDPVDILPTLLKGNECVIDQVEVLGGTWDRTLIRLRDSEPTVKKLVSRNIQSCTPETTGKNQYHALGFQEDDPESSSARLITADEADDFFKLGDVRESLDESALSLASHLTLLESGSVVTTASTKNAPSDLPLCIYAETLGDLQTDQTSCTHLLPGPPGTTYRLATGLSHAILLSESPNPSFNQILGVGDNRHRAAVPRTEESRQPSNTVGKPTSIEALCGIGVSGISAGGYRSAAWTEAGEGFIWGKGIEGISGVELPASQHDDNDGAEGDGDGQIAAIAVGDEYELVLSVDGILWTRGKSP